MPYSDPDAKREADRRYARSATGRRARAVRRHAQRQIMEAAKAEPCLDCKRSFPRVCMDFDHRPGEVKCFNIGTWWGGVSPAALLAEIAKCDLVCANCHRLREAERRLEDSGARSVLPRA